MKVNWPTKKLGKLLRGKDDLIGLVCSFVGSLVIVLSVGSLNGGGDTGGYSFAYITHPISLKIGLILVIIGFLFQLADTLISRHRISEEVVHYILSATIVLVVIITYLL